MCGAGSQWKQAVLILRDMAAAKVPPDVGSYTPTVKACEKHEWALAVDLLLEMDGAGLVPYRHTFTVVISALGNGDQPERTLETFRGMKSAGMGPNVTNNISVLLALRGGRLGGQAVGLLKTMLHEGVAPNEGTYAAIRTACEQQDKRVGTGRSAPERSASGRLDLVQILLISRFQERFCCTRLRVLLVHRRQSYK